MQHMFWKWPASAMLGESRDGDIHDQIRAKRRMTLLWFIKKTICKKINHQIFGEKFWRRTVQWSWCDLFDLESNWSCVCLWHETQLWMNFAHSLQLVVLSWLPLPPVNQISRKYVKQGAPKALYLITLHVFVQKFSAISLERSFHAKCYFIYI